MTDLCQQRNKSLLHNLPGPLCRQMVIVSVHDLTVDLVRAHPRPGRTVPDGADCLVRIYPA